MGGGGVWGVWWEVEGVKEINAALQVFCDMVLSLINNKELPAGLLACTLSLGSQPKHTASQPTNQTVNQSAGQSPSQPVSQPKQTFRQPKQPFNKPKQKKPGS